jgi:hypothetical protein
LQHTQNAFEPENVGLLCKTESKLTVVFVTIVVLGGSSIARAALIEIDLHYSFSLASISGDFGDDQTLGGVSTFFSDDAFYFGLGDTLVFNILFDRRLQVFEFEDPPGSTNQYFSFGLDCEFLCPQPEGGGFGFRWPIW